MLLLRLPGRDSNPSGRNAYNLLTALLNPTSPHNSYLWIYELYSPVRNDFDAGKSITRAIGRGSGPGNRDFFGPCEMASSCQASAIWG
jgi:hypothetical protein